MMVKESVNRAFHASFGLKDQKEGMAAFVEKRKANFRNR
jgi:enoyl-CoA hydratase